MKYFIEKIEYAIAVFAAILTQVEEAIIIAGLLVIIDTITGWWAAKKKKEKTTSKKLGNGLLPKIALYPLILIAGSGAEALFPHVPFIKGATGMIAAVEWVSIMENIDTIFGFSLWRKFKEFLAKRKGEKLDE